LLGNTELAIAALQQAIYLNANEYPQLAKTDSDFDNLRENDKFQALLKGDLPFGKRA
jgi:hypothetical protein